MNCFRFGLDYSGGLPGFLDCRLCVAERCPQSRIHVEGVSVAFNSLRFRAILFQSQFGLCVCHVKLSVSCILRFDFQDCSYCLRASSCDCPSSSPSLPQVISFLRSQEILGHYGFFICPSSSFKSVHIHKESQQSVKLHPQTDIASTALVAATISVTTVVVVVAKAHAPRMVNVSPGMGPLVPSVVAPPQNIQLFVFKKEI